MKTRTIHFRFLAAGPSFSAELPGEFDPVPELSSPLLNGLGGRSFVFVPQHRDEPMGGDNVFLKQLRDRDERPVDLFERGEAPPLWRLRWQLKSGSLYTHLREEDTTAMAPVTVKSISVIEDHETGIPSVVAYPPLEYGASAWPGHEEAIVFTSMSLGSGYSIALERPGRLASSEAVVAEGPQSAERQAVRVGLGEGVDAQVTMGAAGSAEEVAIALRDSFAID